MVSSTLSSVSSTWLGYIRGDNSQTVLQLFRVTLAIPTIVHAHSSFAVSRAIILPVCVDEPGQCWPQETSEFQLCAVGPRTQCSGC